MRLFQPYVQCLDDVLKSFGRSGSNCAAKSTADDLLNGHSNEALQKLVPLDQLRLQGAFFTSPSLAALAAKYLSATLTNKSIILDPMCGSGDLLLACTKYLDIARNVNLTVKEWGNRLFGRDLQYDFVQATQKRLILAALQRHEYRQTVSRNLLRQCFRNITTKCGVSDNNLLQSGTHIIVNPPFLPVKAPRSCLWANGKVNSAALYFEDYVTAVRPGTRIVAILPDVLRSGSRYRPWRQKVASYCRLERIQIYGRFDHLTDVDVFLLVVEVKSKRPKLRPLNQKPKSCADDKSSELTIGDYFQVIVGPVVNYRAPKLGKWYPFIQSKSLRSWIEVRDIDTRRRFKGTVIKPPFVVVRRTSAPRDKFRARATIIATQSAVAVENHLIVLKPRNSTLKKCREVLRVLRDNRTSEWLNQRIRCRHLTTSAVRDIPWWIL